MAILYEYQKPMYDLSSEFCKENNEDENLLCEFKKYLDDVWAEYKEVQKEIYPNTWYNNLSDDENDEDISKKQPFIFFDGFKIKPKGYIGFIKFKNHEFNLYPKICKDEQDCAKINKMLLLWLQYSDNLLTPKFESDLTEIEDCRFFEYLIFIFAKYTSDLLSTSIYQHYEEITEDTSFLKGRLNFNQYIKNMWSGKANKFNCTYDSFEINNKFNQIIKYMAKSLYNATNNTINQNYLYKIISALDEADDVVCSYETCKSVYINRFMEDFNIVLDFCKLFLKNSVIFDNSGKNNNFTFLIKTDRIFEDFISNFAKEKIKEFTIEAQKESYLDKNNKFKIKPDLIIKDKNKIEKIIDIKYKQVSKYSDISNADIYQCVTYAQRLGCNEVVLLYPKYKGVDKPTVENEINNEKEKALKPIIIPLPKDKNTKVNISFKFIDCCPCDGDYEEKIKQQIEGIVKH